MATNSNVFSDKETNNWFKACIALNFTRDGLTHFVEREIKHVHNSVGRSCGNCCTENLVRCPTNGICKHTKNCNYHTQTKQPRQCPTKLCDLAAKSITSQHRYNGPSWFNTQAELWSTDHWQIAKCFFPPDGYLNVSSIHETDFNGVISVLLNCKHFDSCISFTIAPKPPAQECLLTRARQIGRAIRHTPDCKVTDAELHDFFQTLDTLLADPKCLAQDPAATAARNKLFNNDRLSLTELGELLKEANQTLTHAKEAGERFSEKAERTLTKGLNDLETAILAGVKRLESKTHDMIVCLKQASNEKEKEDYERAVADLLRRLVDHYRDTVSYVPLSSLDPSFDKHVHDVYATPKIYMMKIELDGTRTKQEPIFSYKDCFCRSGHLSRRTYLQGEPGSGKTCFAAKLVYDWCNVHASSTESLKEKTAFADVDTLHKFKFLFFLSLRDSMKQTYVTQMIKAQLIYKIYAEDEWESAYTLVLKIMKNVMYLVVQDGLDEWPGEEVMPSMDGIPKDHCIVLTTSRPWKLADERIKNSQIDILLQLEGISNPIEFNEKILHCLLDKTKDPKETGEQFHTFLERRGLEWLSSSPMLNTLVLCTWVDDKAERLTGSSLCELYTTMLENLFKKANAQISYFEQCHLLPVNCFARTKYIRPNMEHIDLIAKAAFSFLFSNEKESSLVFSDVDLTAHLPESSKQFALDSGLLSKRKGKKCTDQTLSFVHKTIQEFLTAFHIHRNADVIDEVISGYLKRHDNSYLDISQMFIFLCGFNISAANKLSTLMNEIDVYSNYDNYFQACIISGYREAVANKNTPIQLHLSHFSFDSDNAEDFIHIWKLNTSRARSLDVWPIDIHVTIRSKDASSADCQGHWPVDLTARKDLELFMALDLSSCHNLESLVLGTDVTVVPNVMVGLKKLKHLSMFCKCESLDLTHFEHIESIKIPNGVNLIPLSFNNYKTLVCIEILTTYDGLDLSIFENLNSITISDKVTVLHKPLLIHNRLTSIRLVYFNRVDNKAIHTWCLLNGVDPVQCESYTPVLTSITYIMLDCVTCSSTWLRSMLRTLLTLDHKVECYLALCTITSLDQDVKSRLQGSHISCVEGEASESYTRTSTSIIKYFRNTCTFNIRHESPGLWGILHGLNVKNLSLRGSYTHLGVCLKVNHVSSLSQSLASIPQLEALTMHLSVYINLQLPPSLKHLTVYYDTLSPSELRHLVNKLCASTKSVECRLEFLCGNTINNTITNIPPEEYIPIKHELEALKHVEVKRFRIYDRWSGAAWSVRNCGVDDFDHGDDIGDEELCRRRFKYYAMLTWHSKWLDRISIRLKINCKQHN